MPMKLGASFADNVILQKNRFRRKSDGKEPWWLGSGRILLFASFMMFLFFILIVRLFHLTIIRGHEYRALADGNRTRELIRHAPRGIMYDRTGKRLTENDPEYRLLHPCGTDSERRSSCVERVEQKRGLEMSQKGLPAGTFLEVDYHRRYPYGENLAHMVGYTGEITQEELADPYYTLRSYKPRDRLGRMGAEVVYEDRLRGKDGKELVEVDAAGKILRTLGRLEELAGEDITLSVDADISKAAADAFPPGLKGAVVVARPATGEILALFASPGFDPNAFSKGLTPVEYQALFDNPDRPMFNRAIGGAYPPGSTFKIVTALAALEEKAIAPGTLIEDTGVITIGQFSFGNWYFLEYGKTDGALTVTRAIARSNDIFFYKTGEKLGITKLAAWAARVGVGKPLGIELPGEAGGLMPDPAWKAGRFTSAQDRERKNDLWYTGDTYHVSIGQGYLLTTPLQVNTWTNIIASGGKLCRPTIEKIKNTKGEVRNCKPLGVKKETLALIEQGMKQACEPGGTGWPLFNFTVLRQATRDKGEAGRLDIQNDASSSAIPIRVPVACKTGTAEFGDPNNRTHAWFTAYAPLRAEKGDALRGSPVIMGEPEISVTVLVEEGGQGSEVGAPIAKKVLEAWFSR